MTALETPGGCGGEAEGPGTPPRGAQGLSRGIGKAGRRMARRRRMETSRTLKAAWKAINGRARAQGRTCGPCVACSRELPCAWREGLLADDHRPDLLGIVVDARILPGTPAPIVVTVVRELVEGSGVLDLEAGREIVSAFAAITPVLVAIHNGDAIEKRGFPQGFQAST